MNTSDMLGILGILATVVFGVWGLIVVLRRRYPGEISFVREPYLALFETIVKNIPELTAQYNGKPVSPGLVLLRGALLNSGKKDICDTMVEGKLTFNLPDGFKWLTSKIIATSPNVEASVLTEERRLVFSTGLFRCGEFIRFQAITEALPSDSGTATDLTERLESALKIDHRIADTSAVKVIDLEAQPGTPLLTGVVSLFVAMTAVMMVINILNTSAASPSASTTKVQRDIDLILLQSSLQARTNYERSLTNLALLQDSLQVITNYERTLTNPALAQNWRPANQTLESNLKRTITNLALAQSWWWTNASKSTKLEPVHLTISLPRRGLMDWFSLGTISFGTTMVCLLLAVEYRNFR